MKFPRRLLPGLSSSRTLRYLSACCLAAIVAAPGTCYGQHDPRAKKVIEWGWDEPDTQFIREHIAEMEQLPFDGFVFHINSSKGGNFVWEMWGTGSLNGANSTTRSRT